MLLVGLTFLLWIYSVFHNFSLQCWLDIPACDITDYILSTKYLFVLSASLLNCGLSAKATVKSIPSFQSPFCGAINSGSLRHWMRFFTVLIPINPHHELVRIPGYDCCVSHKVCPHLPLRDHNHGPTAALSTKTFRRHGTYYAHVNRSALWMVH